MSRAHHGAVLLGGPQDGAHVSAAWGVDRYHIPTPEPAIGVEEPLGSATLSTLHGVYEMELERGRPKVRGGRYCFAWKGWV